MKDRTDRKYRVADCCDNCENETGDFDSKSDEYFDVCSVDGRRTAAWFTCEDFKRAAKSYGRGVAE